MAVESISPIPIQNTIKQAKKNKANNAEGLNCKPVNMHTITKGMIDMPKLTMEDNTRVTG